MNIIEEIRNDISGAEALADWLGNEPPVNEMVALFRAERCVQGDAGLSCPLNVEPGWWERNVKDPIARWITRELEEQHRMNLNTPYDDQLHICKICGCAMRLKVWTPASVLRRHINKKQLNQSPSWCWLRKELLP